MTGTGPILGRELRAIARDRAQYGIRVIAGLLGTVLLGLSMTDGSNLGGGQLLFQIHAVTVCLMMLLIPVLTADSISREKREGTLELLWLTPLQPGQVLWGKFQVQLIHALTFWLALIPVSVVPFLVGGVGLAQVGLYLVLQGTVIFVALTAGLVASAMVTSYLGGIFWAYVLSSSLIVADMMLLVRLHERDPYEDWLGQAFEHLLGKCDPAVWMTASGWRLLLANGLLLTGIATIVFRYMGRKIREDTHDERKIERRNWIREKLFRPVILKDRLSRTLRSQLATNPLIWLEYRTAWRRTGRWLLLGGVLLVESVMLMRLVEFGESIWAHQWHLLLAVVILMVVTAAGSFHQERQSGAFELLLVAPFTEWSLFSGRLRAVWMYYRPVLVLLLLFGVLLRNRLGYLESSSLFGGAWSDLSDARFLADALSIVCSLVTVPVAGLYWALRSKSYLKTLVATGACGLLLPLFCTNIFQAVIWFCAKIPLFDNLPVLLVLQNQFANEEFPYVQMTLAVHLLLNIFFVEQTLSRLKNRTFAE